MRTSYLLSVVTTLFLLFSYSTAWPWPPLDSLIMRRQNDENTSSPPRTDDRRPTATQTDSPSSGSDAITAEPTPTDSNSDTRSDSNADEATTTGTDSGSDTATATDSKTDGTKTTDSETTITNEPDPRLPAGGISMITPNPLSGSNYFRVGLNVTLAWKYTSLSVTPNAVDILASCSQNQETYTIAANQSVEETGSVTWDTNQFQTAPFPVASYTLIIHDAESDITARPRAGYLGVANQFTFGMYTPAPYADIDDGFRCATCFGNGAPSLREAAGLAAVLGTLTVLGFTWFVGNAGMF
ncbi:MAG: hypothetical protein M1817_002888 [Caeruleum heppii]|nr:MAG: hypothetical protein M1817_002888 [Caeruleum heppii]